ncbi:unnamed protein product [Musa hybrid cultivar]
MGVEALLSAATYRKLWFPNCFHRDFLEVMFTYRKEKAEMLETLVISCQKPSVLLSSRRCTPLFIVLSETRLKSNTTPTLSPRLGERITLKSIEKPSHLIHLERPFVHNRCLKESFVLIHAQVSQK